jgi:hypothetical protein
MTKKDLKSKFALLNTIRKLKDNMGLSTLIMLGMIVWAKKKGFFPKKDWVEWIFENIWSHTGNAFESLPGEDQVLRIKESVIQGYRRRIFEEHYNPDTNYVRFVRLVPCLSRHEIEDLTIISDWQIENNKGYQFPSIIAYIPYILSGGKIAFFPNTPQFTICYESTYRNLQYIRLNQYPGDPEHVTIFDIKRDEIQERIF